MRLLSGIGICVAILLAALWALKESAMVSAEVVSCEPDGKNALITLSYMNRLPITVFATFDLALTRYGSPYSRMGGGGIAPVNRKHFDSLPIGAGQQIERVERVPLPPKWVVANAIVLNFQYATAKAAGSTH